MRLPSISWIVVLALSIASPAMAAPGDMSIATFLEKSEHLEKRGALAMLSSEFKALKSEIAASGAAYRTKIKTDKNSGSVPHSCPPEKADINSSDLLKHFRGYSSEQRRSTTVRRGFFDLMKKRYPCS